ncbi:hypothetical protein [Chitinophaga pinensis]|uniref:Uncharacterized protein n=1 Tax=Chitinophaga pinensis TaxID=79329 RepID=A0A5C6LPS2_9BACT|nr:hypothetical protein [Chitinophaga pinensis]TWV97438.1 hypothetical protein FEF09_21540 [Chitinophaga pinensis]
MLIGARHIDFLRNNKIRLLEASNITAAFIGILLVVILIAELIWHYYYDPADGHVFFSYRFRAYLPA